MAAATYSPSILPPTPILRLLLLLSTESFSEEEVVLFSRTSFFDVVFNSRMLSCSGVVGDQRAQRGVVVGCRGRSLELGFSRPDWCEAMTAGPPQRGSYNLGADGLAVCGPGPQLRQRVAMRTCCSAVCTSSKAASLLRVEPVCWVSRSG